ncbi:MAG: flagellar protein FliS [bacterium]|jgi:flagellar protein FliS
MAYNSYQAYQNTSIQTSNQKQLILMLFDGMNRFMTKGIEDINQTKYESAHKNLTKVGKILLELLSTLREDRGGEIGQNLKKLYLFCYENIVIANLKKDTQKIREIQKILNNLRDGWAQTKGSGVTKTTPKAMPQKVRYTG